VIANYNILRQRRLTVRTMNETRCAQGAIVARAAFFPPVPVPPPSSDDGMVVILLSLGC
jgi:hypothetical protein